MAYLLCGERRGLGLFVRLCISGLLPAGCGRVGVELMVSEADAGSSHPCVISSGSNADSDADGTPDCADLCPNDADKVDPGACGCMVAESSSDVDGDGEPDCIDVCDGVNDARYVPDATCGVGYCLSSNTPSSCVDGVETACVPGEPLTDDDATCDGVDDNCDGSADEDYVAVASSCGEGVCLSAGELVCSAGGVVDTCEPGAPTGGDDEAWPGNGLDDDCDGDVDEAVINPCDTTPMVFVAGAHPVSVPLGCGQVTVQLWGGGGGSGGKSSIGETGVLGPGGAGGYAESTVNITGSLQLFVGNGGSGCGAGATNAGASTYNGGGGGGMAENGSPGQDRNVGGGGAGGNGVTDGGRGHYGGGGGGGGALAPWPPYPGDGGGGGAASVLLMDGTPVVVAGGGGGGGGANGSSPTSTSGAGGSGCGGDGGDGSAGGGGGGGMCSGAITHQGTDAVPHNSEALPANTARGGSGDCGSGGPGYAVLTFAP